MTTLRWTNNEPYEKTPRRTIQRVKTEEEEINIEQQIVNQSESIQKVAMLHNHRFFDSHNRVVQAYPLRKAVVQQETSSPSNAIKIGNVNDVMSLSGSVLPEVNTFITHLSSSITQEL